MNYLLKSNRGTRKTSRIVAGVVVVVVCSMLIYGIFPRLFPTIFSAIGLPLWKTETMVTENSAGFWGYFMWKRQLLEENLKLKEENLALTSRLFGYEILEKENAELKVLKDPEQEEKSVLAAVLKKPPVTPYDNLIVEAGSKQGVAVGDKVFVAGNNIVGEIEEVLGSTSRVKLYSTSGHRTDVELATSTIQAVAIGRGGGSFEAIMPRDAKITRGDVVVLPGSRLQIFGIVEDTTIDPARAFQRVLLRSPFPISKITWVNIVTQ